MVSVTATEAPWVRRVTGRWMIVVSYPRVGVGGGCAPDRSLARSRGTTLMAGAVVTAPRVEIQYVGLLITVFLHDKLSVE